MKVLTKDVNHVEKIGRKHRTDPSSLTKATNALTVQAIREPVIVQQGSNHMHPILATLLMVQVFKKKNSQFQNNSLQQHSQQSASTVGISTPTLMVNNQLRTGPQGQQWHPSPQVPPVIQQANSPIRHHQFNQHFQQLPVPQVSPLMAPPQQFNPQTPPPDFY